MLEAVFNAVAIIELLRSGLFNFRLQAIRKFLMCSLWQGL